MEWKYQYNQKIQEREKLYQEFWQQRQRQHQRQQQLQIQHSQQQQQEIQLQEWSQQLQQLQRIRLPALSKSRKQRINQKKRDDNKKLPTAVDCVLKGMASAGVAVFLGVVGVAIMAADL
uniref:Uncharacterized protein n=1 Tax=Bactrocera latifrons TaxID=174628 RepID=A0A0K8VK93_BACLA